MRGALLAEGRRACRRGSALGSDDEAGQALLHHRRAPHVHLARSPVLGCPEASRRRGGRVHLAADRTHRHVARCERPVERGPGLDSGPLHGTRCPPHRGQRMHSAASETRSAPISRAWLATCLWAGRACWAWPGGSAPTDPAAAAGADVPAHCGGASRRPDAGAPALRDRAPSCARSARARARPVLMRASSADSAVTGPRYWMIAAGSAAFSSIRSLSRLRSTRHSLSKAKVRTSRLTVPVARPSSVSATIGLDRSWPSTTSTASCVGPKCQLTFRHAVQQPLAQRGPDLVGLDLHGRLDRRYERARPQVVELGLADLDEALALQASHQRARACASCAELERSLERADAARCARAARSAPGLPAWPRPWRCPSARCCRGACRGRASPGIALPARRRSPASRRSFPAPARRPATRGPAPAPASAPGAASRA